MLGMWTKGVPHGPAGMPARKAVLCRAILCATQHQNMKWQHYGRSRAGADKRACVVASRAGCSGRASGCVSGGSDPERGCAACSSMAAGAAIRPGNVCTQHQPAPATGIRQQRQCLPGRIAGAAPASCPAPDGAPAGCPAPDGASAAPGAGAALPAPAPATASRAPAFALASAPAPAALPARAASSRLAATAAAAAGGAGAALQRRLQ